MRFRFLVKEKQTLLRQSLVRWMNGWMDAYRNELLWTRVEQQHIPLPVIPRKKFKLTMN